MGLGKKHNGNGLTLMSAVAVCLLVSLALPCAAGIKLPVFIMAGQSNMVGGGGLPALSTGPVDLQSPQTDVLYQYRLYTNARYDSADWIPLKHLSGIVTGTSYGPEITFGRSLVDQLPADKIAIIKVAANGTSLQSSWNPDATSGKLLYNSMIDRVNSALSQLPPEFDPVISGFAWVQGSGDANSATSAAQYQANLINLITNVRSDFGDPDLPFVFSQLHIDSDKNAAFKATLRQGQENVAFGDDRTAMVNIDDLPLKPDNIHYTGAARLDLGYRLANAYLTVIPEPGSGLMVTVLVIVGTFRRSHLLDHADPK